MKTTWLTLLLATFCCLFLQTVRALAANYEHPFVLVVPEGQEWQLTSSGGARQSGKGTSEIRLRSTNHSMSVGG